MICSADKAKLPLFEMVELATPRCFLGLSVETREERHFKDAQKLARDFAEARERLRGLAYPYVSVTITGKKDAQGGFLYFTGEEVEPKAKAHGLAAFQIPAGTYAQITVRRNPTWLLAMRLAKARKHFYQVYLPASGYEMGQSFEEAEVWEQTEEAKPRRQQRVMLWVPLIKKNTVLFLDMSGSPLILF